MIHVHNLRGNVAACSANSDPRHVYVGRSMARQGLTGSPLGNPFRLEREEDRQFVLHRYEHSIRERISWGGAVTREFTRLCELARTGDLHLYCWCAPKACHADIIKRLIEEAIKQ